MIVNSRLDLSNIYVSSQNEVKNLLILRRPQRLSDTELFLNAKIYINLR